MAKIIDGKAISLAVKDEIKAKTAELQAKGITATLAVILVGEDPASQVYVKNKKKACEYCGIDLFLMNFLQTQPKISFLSLLMSSITEMM